jgi:hypothetical protein
MPKDLVVVGQGGIARRNDLETPKYIKGLCTYGLETCVALFMMGDRGNVSLIHVDSQTTIQSIRDEVRALGNLTDCGFAYNEGMGLGDDALMGSIGNNVTLIDEAIGSKLTKVIGRTGTLLVNIADDLRITFDDTKSKAELQKRSLFDVKFEDYIKYSRYVNRIFLDTLPAHLEYDVTKFTRLFTLEEGLLQDIEALKGKEDDEIIGWITAASTVGKYPHLGLFLEQGALPLVVQQVQSYFTRQDSARDSLVEYAIPFIDEEKAQTLAVLAEQYGSEDEIKKQRQTDWSMTYTIKLPSSCLVKEVRDKLGIDRVALSINAEQQDFLREHIADIIIEAYPQKPRAPFLVTFPLSEHNREIIDIARTPAKRSAYLREVVGEEGGVPAASVDGQKVSRLAGQQVQASHS